MGCLLIIIGFVLLDNPDSNMQCIGVLLILFGLFGGSSSSSVKRVIRRERVDVRGNVVSTEDVEADSGDDDDDQTPHNGGGVRLNMDKR